MKRFLLFIVLVIVASATFAQDKPNDIKRYDFKKVGKYDDVTYTVLVITDCVTNQKEYNLRLSFYGNELSFSDGIAAKILSVFNYLINTQFDPELKGEESFIVCEVSEGFYFRFKPDARHLDLVWNNNVIAGINKDEIKEFQELLSKIEKTFTEKGRDLKDAVIKEEYEKPLF